MKSEAPSVKKRKSEWAAAMKKMKGDTSLVKDKGSKFKLKENSCLFYGFFVPF